MGTIKRALAVLADKTGNPLDWSPVDKGILISLVVIPIYLQYAAWLQHMLHMPEAASLIDKPRLQILSGHLALIILFSLAYAGLGFLIRPRAAHSRLYQFFAVQVFSACMSYLGYWIGGLSIATGIVMVGGVLFGFILFDLVTVLPGLALALVIVMGTNYASALGLIPYAPVLARAPMENGHLSILWLDSMVVFSAPHLVALLGLSAWAINRWQQREMEVKHLSVVDPLTNVANRRQIITELEREVERTRRHGLPLAVVMVDLDHFKRINDNYGHQVGDRVLRTAASVLAESVRRCDLVGRYGGEEFILLLPETTAQGALEVAERCRQRLADTAIVVGGQKSFTISGSFGVATGTNGDITTPEALIHAADQALYEAKENGRNRVVSGCVANGHR